MAEEAKVAAEAAVVVEKEVKMVPEAAVINKETERRAAVKEATDAKKALEDFKAEVAQGATKKEVAKTISDLGKKYNLDENFLEELASVVKSDTSKEIDEKIAPLTKKEREGKIDSIFKEHFAAAIAEMPEYEDVVNPNVIKTLSLDPANKDKTFSQIIEETYGNAVTGKRTIPQTKTGGGKDARPLDSVKARKDVTYFEEVMDDPKLKSEYNKAMLERGY